jgi:hypothetical protein
MICGERCRRQALFPLLCCVLFPGLLAQGAAAAEPAERALWQLWRQHSTNAPNHEAFLSDCQAFTNQYASDPLAVVGQSMAAWNLLALARQPDAVALLTRHIDRTGTPLVDGAAALAKSWMTRIDREQLKTALQFYYRREVRYPRSLDELFAYPKLPKDPALPRQDRWKTDWRYALVGFKTMPGMLDQKYEIFCSKLGNSGSDLALALAVPYGRLINAKPVRMLSSTPGSETAEWLIAPPSASTSAADAKTAALGAGSTAQGLSVAYIGKLILVAYDKDHWKLFVRPAK